MKSQLSIVRIPGKHEILSADSFTQARARAKELIHKVHLTVRTAMSPGGLIKTYVVAFMYVAFFLLAVESASQSSLLVLRKRHIYLFRSKSSIPTQTINLLKKELRV